MKPASEFTLIELTIGVASSLPQRGFSLIEPRIGRVTPQMNPTGLIATSSAKAPGGPGRQRGITLIIALIALVALTMAGIALVRSVDTGNVIAGNFAFRQASLQATDTGVEGAVVKLGTIIPAGVDTAIANQYFPLMQPLDANGIPTTVDWSAVTAANLGSNNEYQVKYVIERLCTGALPIDAADLPAQCIVDQSSKQPNSAKLGTAGCGTGGASAQCDPPLAVNYRVTVRVEGPRNTVAMSQAVVAY